MAEVDAWSVGVPSPTNDRRYLIVAFTPVHHVPARGTIEALTRAAELAAVVLLRARSDELLTYAAHHDQLTQLANRHGLIEHVAAMSPRSEDIAVMFIDLDGFKQINDRHGHAAGDYVLTVLAERIASVTRPIDFVARLGGDEFAVVIGMSPGHPPAPEAAGWVAERILDAFCRPIDSTWGPLEMSGSIGVVTVDPDTDIQAAIAGADRAMYVAKTAGGAQMHRVSDS
jgi:diguanylate cyclase (GGDEF)-like protein